MKNYLPKLERYILSLKNNVSSLRSKNPFSIIISSIALVFLLLLYFTIPTFYNYENYEEEIQKKVSKDFKLNLKNISNITYLIVPAPHFLIEECDLYFANDSNEKITTVRNLKINIYSKNLHKKDEIELKNINLNKLDLDLQYIDIKNFYNHLKYSITKPIYFTNSNLFFREHNNEIISISKIKKFEYFSNLQNKEKQLNILGNLFGSDISLKWKKDYLSPSITESNIKFKYPNINIFNKFNNEEEELTLAQTNIKFSKNNLNLNYKFNSERIELFDDESKKINYSKLIGNIKLDPFFFDLNLILSGIKIQTVLNNIFLNLYKINKSSHTNFNGNLKISLNEINNRLFEDLIININFLDKKISLNESSLHLKKVGKINFSDPEIYEKNQKIFVKSKIKFNVSNQEELFRRFLIPRQNRVDLNKVYFEIEYNVDEGNYYLSNINFNKGNNNKPIFYEINNIQQLNNLISREFKKISLE
tara:strand:+ start:1141 stop:2571 length:1431 start_codon:yes stop_codon:yes gene_type:complete